MPRGRPPLPKKLNDLRGDPGKRRRNTVEPEPEEGYPDCPQQVKDDPIANAEWQSTCDHLSSMNLLAKTDKTVLELYAITYSKWNKANENVRKYGDVLLLGENKYPTMSPWANWERRYAADMLKMLTSFGLDPAARARMRQPIANTKKKKSKWDGVLKVVS